MTWDYLITDNFDYTDFLKSKSDRMVGRLSKVVKGRHWYMDNVYEGYKHTQHIELRYIVPAF